ncbi:MAG: hypothetical protein SWQ30_16330 [Thermodesulfobacteriota bacterium]|nr:hypothetical protein [Thermodesulfobacteriota bacterium]
MKETCRAFLAIMLLFLSCHICHAAKVQSDEVSGEVVLYARDIMCASAGCCEEWIIKSDDGYYYFVSNEHRRYETRIGPQRNVQEYEGKTVEENFESGRFKRVKMKLQKTYDLSEYRYDRNVFDKDCWVQHGIVYACSIMAREGANRTLTLHGIRVYLKDMETDTSENSRSPRSGSTTAEGTSHVGLSGDPCKSHFERMSEISRKYPNKLVVGPIAFEYWEIPISILECYLEHEQYEFGLKWAQEFDKLGFVSGMSNANLKRFNRLRDKLEVVVRSGDDW